MTQTRYARPATSPATALHVLKHLQAHTAPGGTSRTAGTTSRTAGTTSGTAGSPSRGAGRILQGAWRRRSVAALAVSAMLIAGLLAAEAYARVHPALQVRLLPQSHGGADAGGGSGASTEATAVLAANAAAEIAWVGVRPDSLSWLLPGPWRDEIARDITRSLAHVAFEAGLADASGRVQLRTHQLPRRLAQALETSPWVHAVAAVRVAYPHQLELDLRLREPIFAVPVGNGRIVTLDDAGHLMPLAFTDDLGWQTFQAACSRPLRRIDGLAAGTTGATGATGALPDVGAWWDHPGVQAAVQIEAVLPAFEAWLPIEAIDVANIAGQRNPSASEIVLATRAPAGHRVTLAWGRTPSQAKFGEPTVGDKLAWLERTLQNNPTLAGVAELDLRFAPPLKAAGRPQ
mgnify:CR=1 FL=1